jgi:type II secretory pathway pseudopilin PulG
MAYVAVAGIAVSLGSSLLGSSRAQKEAKKQRALMWNMKLLELAEQGEIAYEQIRTQEETKRIEILSTSLLKYREALQKESTIRLRDSWIYIAGLGAGTGAIYGIFLMYSKTKNS